MGVGWLGECEGVEGRERFEGGWFVGWKDAVGEIVMGLEGEMERSWGTGLRFTCIGYCGLDQ